MYVSNEIVYHGGIDRLRQQIITEFAPMWELNDRGHRAEHFAEVEKCGHHINEMTGGVFKPKLILFFAWFHDLFAWSRDNHHILSAKWIETTNHPLLDQLTPGERKLVMLGCLKHRASYKGSYSQLFEELCASADRGFPGDVQAMLDRSMKYQLDRGLAATEEVAREMAIAHLKEKFSSEGYANYPATYLKKEEKRKNNGEEKLTRAESTHGKESREQCDKEEQ